MNNIRKKAEPKEIDQQLMITDRIGEIFKRGELYEVATTRKIRAVRPEGPRQFNREIQFYNLDPISSVGYRVNFIRVWVLSVRWKQAKRQFRNTRRSESNRTALLFLISSNCFPLNKWFPRKRKEATNEQN